MNPQIVEQLRRPGARMPVALISSLCLALFGRASREAAANTNNKLTVVHQSNTKLFIANIDLPQRQVTTKDLPAIP
jgi:hypothetical protein